MVLGRYLLVQLVLLLLFKLPIRFLRRNQHQEKNYTNAFRFEIYGTQREVAKWHLTCKLSNIKQIKWFPSLGFYQTWAPYSSLRYQGQAQPVPYLPPGSDLTTGPWNRQCFPQRMIKYECIIDVKLLLSYQAKAKVPMRGEVVFLWAKNRVCLVSAISSVRSCPGQIFSWKDKIRSRNSWLPPILSSFSLFDFGMRRP
jgi:hypothetical protein